MSRTVDVMHGSQSAGDLEQVSSVGPALHPDQPVPHLWPLHDYLERAAVPTAVACARLHSRNLLWEWGLDWLAPDAELLVAELITNAVKATVVGDEAAVRLRLSSDGTRVLIEVWDVDPWPPTAADCSEHGRLVPLGERGRGLFLVVALSARWAWYPTKEPRGKVVWCQIEALGPQGTGMGERGGKTVRSEATHWVGHAPLGTARGTFASIGLCMVRRKECGDPEPANLTGV